MLSSVQVEYTIKNNDELGSLPFSYVLAGPNPIAGQVEHIFALSDTFEGHRRDSRKDKLWRRLFNSFSCMCQVIEFYITLAGEVMNNIY